MATDIAHDTSTEAPTATSARSDHSGTGSGPVDESPDAAVTLFERGARLVILEGTPGSGKTAAAERLAAAVGGPQLWLRGLPRDRDRDLQTLLRGVGDRLAATARSVPMLGAALEPLQDRESALQAGRGLLADCGKGGEGCDPTHAAVKPGPSLLVVLDDAEYADDATLDLLLQAVSGWSLVPIRVLLSSGPLRAASPVVLHLLYAVADLVVSPAPLSFDEAARKLSERGLRPEPAVVAELLEQTGARAATAEYCVSELPPAIPTEEVRTLLRRMVPAKVRRGVLSTLARFDPRDREIAVGVAVLGSDTTLERLAEITGATTAEVSAAVRRLGDVGLLDSDQGGIVTPVVCRALLSTLPACSRGQLYADVAELLHKSEAPAAKVAAFLLDAAPNARWWAAEALVGAGRETAARGQLRDASRFFTRALDESLDRQRRIELLADLGQIDARLGRWPAADYLTEAATATSDPARRLELQLAASQALVDLGNPEAAADVLTDALGRLRDDRDADLQGIGQQLAITHHTLRRWTASAPGEPAEGDSPRHRVAAASAALSRCASSEDVRRLLGPPASLVDELVRTAPTGLAIIDAAVILLKLGDPSASTGLLDAAEGARGDARSTVATGLRLWVRAQIAITMGRIEAAAAYLDQAATAVASWPTAAALVTAARADVAALRGTPHVPLPPPGAASAELPRWVAAHVELARARQALREGAPLEASRHAATAGAAAAAGGIDNPALLPWRSVLAEAAMAVGDEPRAGEAAHAELELARRYGDAATEAAALLAVARTLPPGEAAERCEEAFGRVDRERQPWLWAVAAVQLGTVQRRLGQRRQGAALLRQARRIARAGGAAALAVDVQRELASEPGRTSGEVLTAAERRVADMVASGYPNAAVAAELVVSVKTVEYHLTKVYAKLGISSRQELGGALADLD